MNKKAFMAGYTANNNSMQTEWENQCRAFGAHCKEAGLMVFSEVDCCDYLAQPLDKTASSEDRACILFIEGYTGISLDKEAYSAGGQFWGGGASAPTSVSSSGGGGMTPATNVNMATDYALINKNLKPTATVLDPWTKSKNVVSNAAENLYNKGEAKLQQGITDAKQWTTDKLTGMKKSMMGGFSKYAPYLAMGLGGLMLLMNRGGGQQQQQQPYPYPYPYPQRPQMVQQGWRGFR